jgi:Fur family peroxide stress response transcriptional regulator
MSSTTIIPRQTKYCQAIEQVLPTMGHATNAELLDALRYKFPTLSATTVHRATTRLAARGIIGIAPSTPDGAMRYDANTRPHDHFLCSSCGLLRDADVKQEVTPILEAAIGDCRISGRLTVSGLCKTCMEDKIL